MMIVRCSKSTHFHSFTIDARAIRFQTLSRHSLLPSSSNLMSASRSAALSIDELRQLLICLITYDVMENPVVASDGHTYEEEAIKLWMKNCRDQGIPLSSPMTGARLTNENLTKNTYLSLRRCQQPQHHHQRFLLGENH